MYSYEIKTLQKASWYKNAEGDLVPVFPGTVDVERDVNATRQIMNHTWSEIKFFQHEGASYIRVLGLTDTALRREMLTEAQLQVHDSEEQAIAALNAREASASMVDKYGQRGSGTPERF